MASSPETVTRRRSQVSQSVRQLNPRKLLLSKWTAVEPRNREKHFLVVKVLEPTHPGGPIQQIEIEAVHSKRTAVIGWRELTDSTRWHQGWV